jgi:phosphotransferase family enzyme
MIAVRTYIGHTLGTHLWLTNIRNFSRKMTWSEKDEIENALRQWIGVKFWKEPVRLELGLSTANVVRIYPKIYNPIDVSQSAILQRSLIVKYGQKQAIEKERLNYEALPERIRAHFVRIPSAVYENQRNESYVIMEDLSGYRTLFERFDKLLRHDNLNLADALGHFLTQLHEYDYDKKKVATNVHLRELYFHPMLDEIDFIFNQVSRLKTYQLLFDVHYQDFLSEFERFLRLHNTLLHAMGRIVENQAHFDGFPLAYMHGDLHSRNIMVGSVGKAKKLPSFGPIAFKLIDLEKLRSDGDAAHDIGQLLTDLELLRVTSKKRVSWKIIENQEKLVAELDKHYQDFAASREDTQFATRLELARARAFIRIAKGQSKRIAKYVEFRGQQQAFELLAEAMHVVEGASLRLENVCKIIRDSKGQVKPAPNTSVK